MIFKLMCGCKKPFGGRLKPCKTHEDQVDGPKDHPLDRMEIRRAVRILLRLVEDK